MRIALPHRLFRTALALLLGAAGASSLAAQGHVHPSGGAGREHGRLGTVRFPNSGAAAAQPAFLRGMALLHSFEYEDAADAFREAQAADPGFALAYWGEALTYKHPLWGQESLDSARAALAKLAPTREARLARAPTPRERAYLESVETLYGEGADSTRSRAYEAALAAMRQRFPDDDEAAALHALAIIANHVALAPDARRAAWLQAAETLEGVYRRNPDHPGAAHYLIHAYDDPALAARGVAAARAYAKIAPAAEHALHMPSHIFVQRGEWDGVAASNEASTAASLAWVARRGGTAADRDWHSFQWLQYAYLQQGRVRDASAMLDSARALLATAQPDSLSANSRRVIGLLEVQFATETGRWPETSVDALPEQAGMRLYLLGRAAAHRGDRATLAEAARRAHAFLATLPDPYRRTLWRKISGEMDAYLAQLDGRNDEAVRLMASAAMSDDSLLISGPPVFTPTRELLGDLLLALGRPAEAAAEYDRALARTPERTPLLLARARAAARLGRRDEAARLYARVLATWRAADADLPALAEVRREASGATAQAGSAP